MIEALQAQLQSIYCLDREYDVRDFLVTDPLLAQTLGQGAMLENTNESLLIADDEEDLALSLFLHADLLQRVEASAPLTELRAGILAELWQVIEGVSHFSCVAFKAAADRRLSLLELELQGEIDKFVTTLLLALAQANERMTRNLHGWLFDDVSFRDDLTEEQAVRYRDANDYAARYCYGLGQQLQQDPTAALSQLRDFYRLPAHDKISHIRSAVLAA